MGRRQFLAAATVTSASALALNRLAGAVDPVFKTKEANASERSGDAGLKTTADKYSHLLSPLSIGNVTLKNRIYSTDSFPAGMDALLPDPVISHYANRAKNGAAIVTFSGVGKHRADITDSSIQTSLLHLTDAVHFYDSRIIASFINLEPNGYNISAVDPNSSGPMRAEKYRMMGDQKEITIDQIKKMTDDFVAKARLYQTLGFDGIHLYMSYRSSILACSLSPAVNRRTDQYGETIENRVRLCLELCKAIKWVCGQDFLIEAQVSGEEEAGGYTIDDLIKYAKLWEGTIDILQLRGWDGTTSHPIGFNSEKNKPMTLTYAEAIKKSGVKIVTAPNGGFHDPGFIEECIAGGKTDMVAMGRVFICEPEYGKKINEGRDEDIVPCIGCNRCHGPSISNLDPPMCSVNPKLGIEHRIDRMIGAPSAKKMVAVIGGGPAGMKAALVAGDRGHRVTLYEKNDFLGGQLKHADYAKFQWPLKEYKEYLIRQMKKSGIEVLLSTRATPELIKKMEFDVIMVAAGAEPIVPDTPGADGKNILTPIFAYGNRAVGKDVVIIGGDHIGTETGIYLAQNGHNVTILTDLQKLATDAPQIHYISSLEMAYEELKNFSFIAQAAVTGISEGRISYFDGQGNDKSIKADSIVISAGRRPRKKEAQGFYGAAGQFFIIGDCNKAGNVQTCTRSAFAAASMI